MSLLKATYNLEQPEDNALLIRVRLLCFVRLLYSKIITESHLSWQNIWKNLDDFLTPHVLLDHTAETDIIQLRLQLARPIMCHTPCYTHYTCQFEQN